MDLLESVSKNVDVNLMIKELRVQTIYNLVTKIRSTGLYISYVTQMPGLNIHVEKSLKHLAQEIAVPKSSASATQLLEVYTLRITVIHTLQLRIPANRVHFCSWLL
jgi:hypothetical protein